MLQLWTATQLGAPQSRIGPLTQCTEALVRRKINDEYTLSVKLPPGAEFENDIEDGQVIISPVDESGTEDRFVIKQRLRSLTGGLDVYAEHQSYLYNGYVCAPLQNIGFASNNKNVFNQIRENAIPYVSPSLFAWEGIIEQRPIREKPPSVPVCLRSLLLGWYASTYGGEFDFYRHSITRKERLGADNGATIRYAVNMVDLEMDDVVDDYASGIVPFWGVQGDSSRPLTMLTEKYIGYTPESFFPIRKIVPVDFTDQFETQPSEADLRVAAQSYVANNAVPYIPRSVSAEHIERPGDRPIGLGDDITIVNPLWRMTSKIRVVGITLDALTKRIVGVELGKLNPGFAGAVRRTK